MSKRIVRVKPGTKNVFGILDVEVRERRKVRKVKRERLEAPIDDDDEFDMPLEERLAYVKRMRRGCVYAPPKTPKSG